MWIAPETSERLNRNLNTLGVDRRAEFKRKLHRESCGKGKAAYCAKMTRTKIRCDDGTSFEMIETWNLLKLFAFQCWCREDKGLKKIYNSVCCLFHLNPSEEKSAECWWKFCLSNRDNGKSTELLWGLRLKLWVHSIVEKFKFIWGAFVTKYWALTSENIC